MENTIMHIGCCVNFRVNKNAAMYIGHRENLFGAGKITAVQVGRWNIFSMGGRKII
jgi:hypothetical protein